MLSGSQIALFARLRELRVPIITVLLSSKPLAASVRVTNTGNRAGLETVQVYFRNCVSSVLTPVKSLIRYRQIFLEPGESRQVAFQLNRSDLSLVNQREVRVTEPGEFILMIGHSSRDEELLQAHFCLK